MSGVPSVDLQDFVSEDPKRKQKFITEIGNAFEQIGFVALSGHFLSDSLVDDLYSEVKNSLIFLKKPKINTRLKALAGNGAIPPLERNMQREEKKVI